MATATLGLPFACAERTQTRAAPEIERYRQRGRCAFVRLDDGVGRASPVEPPPARIRADRATAGQRAQRLTVD
jgi:hypothetical protein